MAAAIKNCIECGWAPDRFPGDPAAAAACPQSMDGVISCCFTGSRCPVNHPENRTVHHYTLQYDVTWTRDLKNIKDIHGGVLDLSGGAIEWNIKPNLVDDGKHTACDDKICNISNSWTVGYEKTFGDGICPGTMMWGYTHQHVGGINSTLL